MRRQTQNIYGKQAVIDKNTKKFIGFVTGEYKDRIKKADHFNGELYGNVIHYYND